MTTIIDTALAYLLGIAWVLAVWLVLILGSYLLWEALRSWTDRRLAGESERPHPPGGW